MHELPKKFAAQASPDTGRWRTFGNTMGRWVGAAVLLYCDVAGICLRAVHTGDDDVDYGQVRITERALEHGLPLVFPCLITLLKGGVFHHGILLQVSGVGRAVQGIV